MRRSGLTLIGILSLVAACAPASAGPTWTYPPPSGPGAPASPSAPSAPSGEALEIEAFDLGFKPAVLEVPAAGRYVIKLSNTGAVVHDITFATGEGATAQPGESASVDVDIPAGGTTFLCSVPGHAAAGMTGEVMVAGAAPSAAPSDDANGRGAGGQPIGGQPDARVQARRRRRRPRRRWGSAGLGRRC